MEWIRVKDKVPETTHQFAEAMFSDKVVILADGEPYIAVRVVSWKQPDVWQTNNGMIDCNAVTYWMPIEPPKEAE